MYCGEMQTLPLDAAWPEIFDRLREHPNMVLVAEPGAGKTTRLPPYLLKSELIPKHQSILMLEPRRLAARAAAARIAEEQNWRLGHEVGYQVRFENKTTHQTRLKILTEGLLGRMLLSDPELRSVGAVIIDEFHERSQHTDLALGLLFELQELTRPDLRIIVMSATLDAESVAKFLNEAPVIRVPGRTFPVEIHHGLKPLTLESGPVLFDRVASTVLGCVDGSLRREGDLLVFLPGTREIRGVRERVSQPASKLGFDTVELHGSLSLEDQDRAIQRSTFDQTKGHRGKIVLATNIAETSLTIDGIGTVIDCGLARRSHTDAAGFSRLSLSRISLASATQRAGRAGRQAAGHCHRLWSKIDESSMPAFEVPEILRTDVSESLMLLMAQGTTHPESFSWYERPPVSLIRSAMQTLEELGFQKNGRLTLDGQSAMKLPLAPRPAKLVLEAVRAGCVELGAELAALISERDIVLRSHDLKTQASIESDVMLRWHLLNEPNSRQVDRFAQQTCLKAARQIERIARDLRIPAPARVDLDQTARVDLDQTARVDLDQTARVDLDQTARVDLDRHARVDDDKVGEKLLLKSFPDRLARRRREGDPSAIMIGAKGVRLAPFSSVERAEFFVAVDSMEPPPHSNTPKSEVIISVASRVERSWIEETYREFITTKKVIVFDTETRQVLEQTASFLRDLPLNRPHAKRATPDDALPVLRQAFLDHWDQWLSARDDMASIEGRLRFLEMNEVIENQSGKLAEWNQAFLDEVAYGLTKVDEVLAKPLGDVYFRYLPSGVQKLLQSEAPEIIRVPSGSEIKVRYPIDRSPFIEVRIQEMFGWASAPKLASGRIDLQLHLLGPNYRPMQVTSDLASFWRHGYLEVRKELRTRYPKHSWPEDPISARPEAKGRRRT